MHRRSILKLIAAAPLALGATRLIAAPASDARLLVVFMRGGYDAANLLVPAAGTSPAYGTEIIPLVSTG